MPTWLIWPIIALSAGLAFTADQCDEYRYERCVAEYPEQADLCSHPRWFRDKTRDWECQ